MSISEREKKSIEAIRSFAEFVGFDKNNNPVLITMEDADGNSSKEYCSFSYSLSGVETVDIRCMDPEKAIDFKESYSSNKYDFDLVDDTLVIKDPGNASSVVRILKKPI